MPDVFLSYSRRNQDLALQVYDALNAKEHQSAWAEHLGVPVEFENSLGIRFVLIPPGEFDMGSTEAEVAKLLEQAKATNPENWYIDRLPSEAPKHPVRITKPFYLGLSEVTQADYERVAGNNPKQLQGQSDLSRGNDRLGRGVSVLSQARRTAAGAGGAGSLSATDGGRVGVRLPGRHNHEVVFG